MRDAELPVRSPLLVRWFTGYARRYMARHFHAVRRSRTSHELPEGPLLVAVNHPAWWDAMMMFVGVGLYPQRRHFAPMEEAMLAQYRFFRRLGLFGVSPTPRGGARFLRTSMTILDQPESTLWVTAQGRFADVRERPLGLKPGIAAVACRMTAGHVMPLAIEYPFWNERTPEALFRLGPPVPAGRHATADAWQAEIDTGLTATMDALAAESITRDPSRFETIVRGRRGVGGVYDVWRRITGRRIGHGGDE